MTTDTIGHTELDTESEPTIENRLSMAEVRQMLVVEQEKLRLQQVRVDAMQDLVVDLEKIARPRSELTARTALSPKGDGGEG